MLEIFGKNYYIDIDQINEKCKIETQRNNTDQNENETEQPVLEINVFKFEIIKMCVDRLFSEYEEENDENDKLLYKNIQMTTSFNLAFNTLIKYEIIKEDE